jgi:hypothetical protein
MKKLTKTDTQTRKYAWRLAMPMLTPAFIVAVVVAVMKYGYCYHN